MKHAIKEDDMFEDKTSHKKGKEYSKSKDAFDLAYANPLVQSARQQML